MPIHYGPPGSPYGPPPHMSMQGPPPPGYGPPMLPPFQHPLAPPHPGVPPRPPSPHDIRGQDPLSHDMSNTQALAKNFGVSAAIVSDVKMPIVDKEDLAVGSSGLTSGRDRDVGEAVPRDASKWVSVAMRRNSIISPTPSSPSAASAGSSVTVWLPKDRNVVQDTLNAYFTRLNFHRPVFLRSEFEQTLTALYEGQTLQHDPGFVCSVYLVLALGTLSELNHRSIMPPGWPEHEEFFERALAVKPDLRVTVSSLQALILLHWYLYTERQGRTLWRLVGSLIRLAIELGLHHDPTVQDNTFSDEECQNRIRLWGIVLLHDRGTSILLGRPLAIAPSDSNTPRPTRGKGTDISEHFVLADAIMRHATRIIKSMVEFRRQLPDSYRSFFSGTDEWPTERRVKLVQEITEDEGLTLLKIGITRVLLLRALFSSKELEYNQRHRALVDAIVTSHNIIVVHNQLIRFPDIAFFVSPIPLHISAMIALEDVWMALDMLPSFRWRWERKDLNGGHPLIAKLAEKVLDVHLHLVAPTCAPMLLSERDWESSSPLGPGHSPSTPMMEQPRAAHERRAGERGGHEALPDVPNALFYPFFPAANAQDGNGNNGAAASNGGQDFDHLLAEATQPLQAYGYHPGQESYMLEEKDSTMAANAGMQTWMNPRHMAQFGMQPQQQP
ncbi:putative transcriptional regulatory protein C1F7.11c [Grifola frondosa]|uniref:Putative transcriptional regulatory protein C1F7.11c n=1 Tax=Grifola frondosa TaxID=5627 RepID=A0A1C7M6T4_GRIFR|nr:putative transcriptional regulatory protein C1F7.11c [Grifola frondosa]